jgi:hypothetical protein
MRHRLTIFKVLCFTIVFSSALFAQAAGDFQSHQTGNWNDAASWERFDGTSWITPAPSLPDSGVGRITILAGHTITVSADLIADSVFVNGQLNIAAGKTLTVAKPRGSERGVIVNTGGLVVVDGTYKHDRNAGSVPTATWNTGSNFELTGSTGTAPSNANQNFYNVIINCASLSSNLNLAWSGNTIYGDINVLNTASSRYYMTSPTANAGNPITITVMGNINITAGTFSINGSGTPGQYTVDIYGNVNVTAGNFGPSRGSGASGVVNLHGDFTVSNATLQSSSANIRMAFAKGGTQQVTLTNVTLSGGLCWEVANNTIVNLNSNFVLNNSASVLTLTSGKLVTSPTALLVVTTGSVTGASSACFVEGPMTYNFPTVGPASKLYPLGKGNSYRPLELRISHDAAGATEYTAELFNAPPASRVLPSSLTKVSENRYYTITKGAGANVTAASVVIGYDTDDGVTDAANLRIAKDDGAGNWVDLGGVGTAAVTGTITSTNNFTTFSDFVIANALGGSNIIPVELSSFSANANGRNIDLRWITVTETNTKAFLVQKMKMNKVNKDNEWETIAEISAKGTTSEVSNYTFVDKNVSAGSYQYRLKIIDVDGSYDFSDQVNVVMLNPTKVSLSQNYPNPFNPETLIKFEIPQNSFVNLTVFNIIGEKVATLVNENLEAGIYEKRFNAQELSNGIYLYKLVNGNSTITKKMLLIK